jgi:uncharacterized protein (TIGR00255 family)
MGVIASMTGYGRAESSGGRLAVVVEIRSLNHRFLEIGVKLPRGFASSELEVRRAVQGRLARGRADVSVTTRWLAGSRSRVRTDTALAEGYVREARGLAAALGLDGSLSLADVLRLPGVISVEEVDEDESLAGPSLKEALHQALDELCRMRLAEGAALAGEIRSHVTALEAWTAGLGELLPTALDRIRERVQARIQGLIAGTAVEPGRLIQEAALWAARSDIQEELARLAAHGAQFRGLLDAGGAVGRQLDFLVQEMHREVNTIASKADDQALVERVLPARTTVERLREQVQNVE